VYTMTRLLVMRWQQRWAGYHAAAREGPGLPSTAERMSSNLSLKLRGQCALGATETAPGEDVPRFVELRWRPGVRQADLFLTPVKTRRCWRDDTHAMTGLLPHRWATSGTGADTELRGGGAATITHAWTAALAAGRAALLAGELHTLAVTINGQFEALHTPGRDRAGH
jgi:hypothetical protein